MHIQKLRLVGFKSFVEPTDLVIEQGLTGVVGPNGCGKSNLLEALRWVMGESSYKSMRASAMDDVIFSGTVTRPARNSAEVTIFIDNSKRIAPVEFNDTDEIEITRRIEREAGSAYRINGREARARDIKILFEDAATGARSPALVRQGQIGEIVNAKPEQRRRILEDAAGIAGLHSRRHEAELRLKAAENNLARIGDILGQLKSQLDGLKRQARQARRYAELSDQIRTTEAIVFHLTWAQAQTEVTAEEAALQHALQELGLATQQEAEIIRLDAELSAKMQPLRDEAMVRSTVLTRQRHELEKLTGEAERITARQTELSSQSERLSQDSVRETQLIEEAQRQEQRLQEELAGLKTELNGDAGRTDELKQALITAENNLAETEARNNAVHKQLNEHRSEERSLTTLLNERRTRLARLASQIALLDQQLVRASQDRPDSTYFDELTQRIEQMVAVIEHNEQTLAECEMAIQQANEQQQGARDRREQALVDLRSLEAEQRTLVNLLQSPTQSFPPVLDQISVTTGLETALASALGDDIEAALDVAAPVYWDPDSGSYADSSGPVPDLPAMAEPLLNFVEAPPALHRRLACIGLVDASDGARLQAKLLPGQRLVSKAGDLWRWDGLVARADAPSPAAQRLAGRNRLQEIKSQHAAAVASVETAENQAKVASEAIQLERSREQSLRQSLRQDRDAITKLQAELATLERKLNEFDAQLEITRTTRSAAQVDHDEVAQQISEGETALNGLADSKQLEQDAEAIATTMRQARDKASELKATVSGLERDRQRLRDRIERVGQETKNWQARAHQSEERLKTIARDLEVLAAERKALSERPDELEQAREKLRTAIAVSENDSKEASDAVAQAETTLRETAVELRERASLVAEKREHRARADARLEGARLKRANIVQVIHDTLDTTPEGCLQVAEITDPATLPSLSEADTKLAKLKSDRERLGGVNLQAERELSELETQHGSLDHERADVEEAIAKLRAGIASLNREGRKRLKEAFVTVDGHFQTLFQTLFNGGEARLSMIESDEDPLAGGLEIIAKPPGKKPTTLSLLSGGEQTLTALSLIFAVFLTNPSPICVLDEVDAPLDDSNVDRFCRMMEKMSSDTDTRFLCITHHPETMARMDRLFGVTMGEKGVSQLVSVDLQMAERFLEAG